MTRLSRRWARAVLADRDPQDAKPHVARALRAGAVEVHSLPQYLEEVLAITRRWQGSCDLAPTTWFRGQGCLDWYLAPAAFRQAHASPQWEHGLMTAFRRRAVPYLRRPPVDDWDWLTLMQHHGAPTRLLDWSEGAIQGLYFAVRGIPLTADGSNGHYAVVWVLDAEALQVMAGFEPPPFDITRDDTSLIAAYLDLTGGGARQIPFAMRPRLHHPRLVGQRGAFTVFGNRIDALELLGDAASARHTPFLVPLRVPHGARQEIMEQLAQAGTSETAFFPDLDGVARECTMRLRVDIERH